MSSSAQVFNDMKIAIMSRWNATCGVSLHAEIIGRKFRELGHDVIVYAPTLESADTDWHHRHIDVIDEPWVHRVFEETDEYLYPAGGSIRSEELLEDDYDAFILESVVRFPVNEFKRIASKIKKKAPLILVMHLGYIRDVDPFMEIDWDKIVVFDSRYAKEILSTYGRRVEEKIVEIPYPCPIFDDVKPIRLKSLEDVFLFFTFGRQPVREYLDYVRALRRLSEKYDFKYLIIRSDRGLPFRDRWIIQRCERPEMKMIHRYLRGSDVHLLPKGDTRAVVISSTLAQTIYSGVPIVVPDTRHFELIPVDENGFGPVVKYRIGDTHDLERKLSILIEDGDLRRRISKMAREYAKRYSDDFVAREFLNLIKSLGV